MIVQCGQLDGIIDTDWFLKGDAMSVDPGKNPGIPFIQGAKKNKNPVLFKTSTASYSCRLVVRLCFPINVSLTLGKSIILAVMPHGQCVMGEFTQWTDHVRCELVHRALDDTLYTGDEDWVYNIFTVVGL